MGWRRRPKSPMKSKSEASKLFPLALDHGVNYICGFERIRLLKALGNSIQRTGTRDHEVSFVEVEECRVVQIDCVLEGEERPQSRVIKDQLIRRVHARRAREAARQAVIHHFC